VTKFANSAQARSGERSLHSPRRRAPTVDEFFQILVKSVNPRDQILHRAGDRRRISLRPIRYEFLDSRSYQVREAAESFA
jgi:hypothetical protein